MTLCTNCTNFEQTMNSYVVIDWKYKISTHYKLKINNSHVHEHWVHQKHGMITSIWLGGIWM
jgi:hypothetical protein